MTKDEVYIAVKLWEAIDLIRTMVEKDNNAVLTMEESTTTKFALNNLQDHLLELLTD